VRKATFSSSVSLPPFSYICAFIPFSHSYMHTDWSFKLLTLLHSHHTPHGRKRRLASSIIFCVCLTLVVFGDHNDAPLVYMYSCLNWRESWFASQRFMTYKSQKLYIHFISRFVVAVWCSMCSFYNYKITTSSLRHSDTHIFSSNIRTGRCWFKRTLTACSWKRLTCKVQGWY